MKINRTVLVDHIPEWRSLCPGWEIFTFGERAVRLQCDAVIAHNGFILTITISEGQQAAIDISKDYLPSLMTFENAEKFAEGLQAASFIAVQLEGMAER